MAEAETPSMADPHEVPSHVVIPVAKNNDCEVEVDGPLDVDKGPSPFHRTLDKLVFTFSVGLLVGFPVLMADFPEALPHTYATMFFLMFATRLYFYWTLHWQFFCIDFCYFTNALLLVYLYAFPDVDELFMVVYTCASGPVFLAVVPFKNRLVLHSWDKMISCFIHIVPAAVVYTIRWNPSTSFNACGNSNSLTELAPTCANDMSYVWLFCGALAFWCAHQVLYTLIVQACCLRFLKKHPEYETSYRHLMRGKGFVYKVATCGGRCTKKPMKIMGFGSAFLAYTLFTISVPLLGFRFLWVNRVVLWTGFMLTAYFGADYYMNVFSRRYQQQQPRMFRKKKNRVHSITHTGLSNTPETEYRPTADNEATSP